MLQSKKQEIKKAWEEKDFVKLVGLGFSSFVDMLCNNDPVPFQNFLEHTGAFFDEYILEVGQQEHLNYVGGKMIMELEKVHTVSAPASICLSADLYFQTPSKQWVMKGKKGQVDSSHFTDWASDSDAIKLQETRRLELSIEPPEAGVK